MFVAFVLGVLLGLGDLVFVGLGLHATSSDIQPGWVISIGLLPAVLTGALAGIVAGGTRESPPAHRRIAIATPPLAVVALLGSVFSMERYIVLAWIPTLVASLALEQATRAPSDAADARVVPAPSLARDRSWVKPVLLGMITGWTTVIVDMLALALSPRCFTHAIVDVTDQIELFALIPAIGIGAVLGAFAHSLRSRSIATRRLLLVTVAVASVCGVAASAGLDRFVLPASIPAVLSVLLLERLTRATPDALPAARVVAR